MDSMEYFYWAIPGLLAGRPGPDEFPWDLDGLRRAGFGAILSLNDSGPFLADVGRYGFAHKFLPLPCSVPPTQEEIRVYRRLVPEALDFVRRHVDDGIPTLVHCHAGKDRTGVVLVCYLCTYTGAEPAEAIEKLREVKPTLLSAPGYEALAYHLISGVG